MQPSQPRWTVTSQRETSDIDQSGQVQTGWQVNFVTGSGQNGSVFVPNTVYANPDTVRALIQQRVDAINAVAGLTG